MLIDSKMDVKDAVPTNYPEMVINKSSGMNQSEQKLISLGYKTFLKLWSFPNPYKIQKVSQELCDLLVVFEDDIIIFSDKAIEYKKHTDATVAWNRWYRRAVQESCKQLLGAYNWIKNYPDRVASDVQRHPLPIKIQITPNTRFHLIAVTHGTNLACQEYYHDDDGELMVDSTITADNNDELSIFCIGQYSEEKEPFIHIFDEIAYDRILRELDTIRDFTHYLQVREELFMRKRVIATGESELLALHLRGIILNNKAVLQEYSRDQNETLIVEKGYYQELIHSSEYKTWKTKLEISYFWDYLLDRTFTFLEKGQSAFTNVPSLDEQNKIFHWMAAEDRYFRYICSSGILSMQNKVQNETRMTRTFVSPSHPDLFYVVLLLPFLPSVTEKEYREVRRNALDAYCVITKYLHPECRYVLGIGHETNDLDYSSEDFCFLDATEWNDEMQESARQTYMEYKANSCLGEITAAKFASSKLLSIKMKGRDRNKPCPCGSGRKFKKCCGNAAIIDAPRYEGKEIQ